MISDNNKYEKPLAEVVIIEYEQVIASSTLEDLENGGEWGWV